MSTYIKTPLVIVRHKFRERLVVPRSRSPNDNKFSTKFEMHKYKDSGVVFQKHTSSRANILAAQEHCACANCILKICHEFCGGWATTTIKPHTTTLISLLDRTNKRIYVQCTGSNSSKIYVDDDLVIMRWARAPRAAAAHTKLGLSAII